MRRVPRGSAQPAAHARLAARAPEREREARSPRRRRGGSRAPARTPRRLSERCPPNRRRAPAGPTDMNDKPHSPTSARVQKSEREWRQELTPERYDVLRRRGTEPPFTGRYEAEKRDGTYRCAACGTTLFSSETKFDSG